MNNTILKTVTRKSHQNANFKYDEKDKLISVERTTIVYEITVEIETKTKKKLRDISRKQVDQYTKEQSFQLVPITTEKLAEKRKLQIPSMVLKEGDQLYYAEIPKNLDMYSAQILGEHKCARPCKRLSAASDENGGCAKVRDSSTCIERYPWIILGYETFATTHDVFVVACCDHYTVFPPRPYKSSVEINAAKINLANFIWPEVDSISEIRRKKDFAHRYKKG